MSKTVSWTLQFPKDVKWLTETSWLSGIRIRRQDDSAKIVVAIKLKDGNMVIEFYSTDFEANFLKDVAINDLQWQSSLDGNKTILSKRYTNEEDAFNSILEIFTTCSCNGQAKEEWNQLLNPVIAYYREQRSIPIQSKVQSTTTTTTTTTSQQTSGSQSLVQNNPQQIVTTSPPPTSAQQPPSIHPQAGTSKQTFNGKPTPPYAMATNNWQVDYSFNLSHVYFRRKNDSFTRTRCIEINLIKESDYNEYFIKLNNITLENAQVALQTAKSMSKEKIVSSVIVNNDSELNNDCVLSIQICSTDFPNYLQSIQRMFDHSDFLTNLYSDAAELKILCQRVIQAIRDRQTSEAQPLMQNNTQQIVTASPQPTVVQQQKPFGSTANLNNNLDKHKQSEQGGRGPKRQKASTSSIAMPIVVEPAPTTNATVSREEFDTVVARCHDLENELVTIKKQLKELMEFKSQAEPFISTSKDVSEVMTDNSMSRGMGNKS